MAPKDHQDLDELAQEIRRLQAIIESRRASAAEQTRAAEAEDAMQRALRDPGFQRWQLNRMLDEEAREQPTRSRRR